jgi:hypothetical protein
MLKSEIAGRDAGAPGAGGKPQNADRWRSAAQGGQTLYSPPVNLRVFFLAELRALSRKIRSFAARERGRF